MKIKLCPNEADEIAESENNKSFDANDGETDTSENCRCRRYCHCQVDESESFENESDNGLKAVTNENDLWHRKLTLKIKFW